MSFRRLPAVYAREVGELTARLAPIVGEAKAARLADRLAEPVLSYLHHPQRTTAMRNWFWRDRPAKLREIESACAKLLETLRDDAAGAGLARMALFQTDDELHRLDEQLRRIRKVAERLTRGRPGPRPDALWHALRGAVVKALREEGLPVKLAEPGEGLRKARGAILARVLEVASERAGRPDVPTRRDLAAAVRVR